ncbi:CbiQ family ECF transporter T component [Nocardioides sp. SYSU D00038]|uniref:CbiQ family ECF transporter T component n=1 Tax=Nocardioides sp. SYSU D00038 TaxID=2812554 RepID=UPI00196725FC|nr:CbiQ family ECF transporter T component [Nocardioides sp. SYSU D00038]
MPAGAFRPGTTLLHRLSPGTKVVALVVLSVATVAIRDLGAALVALGVAVVLSLLARVRLRALARALRYVLLLAVVAGAVQWWFHGRDKAIETFLDLVTLTLLALVLTTTTSVNAMLDGIVRWAGPFRRLGFSPERLALTFSMAIQALPATFAIAVETRDAARARGLDGRPRAYLTPFVVRVVARAHETGDALQARGIGD